MKDTYPTDPPAFQKKLVKENLDEITPILRKYYFFEILNANAYDVLKQNFHGAIFSRWFNLWKFELKLPLSDVFSVILGTLFGHNACIIPSSAYPKSLENTSPCIKYFLLNAA